MNIQDFERKEFERQNNTLNFIASENYPSEEILEANGSIFVAKYAEGFPKDENGKGGRYYQGVKVVDELENACMKECLETFKATEGYKCNVQMTSGCMANMTVYHALLQAGDVVLGPDTASLGHISHGIKGSFLDRYFTVKKYGLGEGDVLDYDDIERIAVECQPKLIICGASNYSQIIDFERFKQIADKVGAILMADVSHIAGLIVTGFHPSPVGYADVITSTLHKTLKGVRGAIIIYREELDKKMKYSTIPGLWGGSHLNNTLAKYQTFKEAQTPEFQEYISNVVKATKVMADMFLSHGIPIVSNSTENHVFCLNLSDFPIDGKTLAETLESVQIVTNANAIPNDTSFIRPHGLRLGCAPAIARGLTVDDCYTIAQGIACYLVALRDGNNREADSLLSVLNDFVKECIKEHPLSHLYPKTYTRLFYSLCVS